MLTLLDVQDPDGDDDTELAPEERVEEVIEALVERAGIEYMAYESRGVISDDIEQTVLDAATEYDTICVGATREGVVSQAVFGSLPETVGEETDETVVMARGPDASALSIREAVVRRLGV